MNIDQHEGGILRQTSSPNLDENELFSEESFEELPCKYTEPIKLDDIDVNKAQILNFTSGHYMQTCEVCYEDFLKSEFTGLSCDHLFCVQCVTHHITTNISSGNAVRIRCMREGCQEVYNMDTI